MFTLSLCYGFYDFVLEKGLDTREKWMLFVDILDILKLISDALLKFFTLRTLSRLRPLCCGLFCFYFKCKNYVASNIQQGVLNFIIQLPAI